MTATHPTPNPLMTMTAPVYPRITPKKVTPAKNPTILHNPYRPPATLPDPIHPCSTLHAWITTPPRQGHPTNAAAIPQATATPNNFRWQQYHQPQLTTPIANEHWGNCMIQPKPSNFFHVLQKHQHHDKFDQLHPLESFSTCPWEQQRRCCLLPRDKYSVGQNPS